MSLGFFFGLFFLLQLTSLESRTIHKSQGQSLRYVSMDLRESFEAGQVYVALSRATSLDGLQVLGFDPAKIRAHPRAIEFVKTLSFSEYK